MSRKTNRPSRDTDDLRMVSVKMMVIIAHATRYSPSAELSSSTLVPYASGPSARRFALSFGSASGCGGGNLSL